MKYKFINANDYFLRDDADTSVLIIRKKCRAIFTKQNRTENISVFRKK